MMKDMNKLTPSSPQPLSFAPDTHVRAYKLARDAGDVVIYATATAGELEGAERQYLGHWHEAAVADGAAQAAPVFVHDGDRAEAEAHELPVSGGFTLRHEFEDDLEAIPIPGHTPGSTAYLWHDGERRYLFTADSVYLGEGGEWRGALLDSSDRDAYLSLIHI